MTTTATTIQVGRYQVNTYDDLAGVALPDLSDDAGTDWMDQAADSATNHTSDGVYIYPIDDASQLEVWVEQSVPYLAQVERFLRTAEEAISYGWAPGDEGHDSLGEYMTAYGFDGLVYETKAAEDYEGACMIWSHPHYYAGTCNAPQPGRVRDDNGNVKVFDTYSEARAYVDEYETAPSEYDGILACNVLSHGQYGSDTLTIIEAE